MLSCDGVASHSAETHGLRFRQQVPQSPVAVLLDPISTEKMKDDAREQLDRVQGSASTRANAVETGSDKPGGYNGQDAAHNVINSGRHTGTV